MVQITEFIEKLNCPFIYTRVEKNENKSNGKDIKGLISGWNKMNKEELDNINKGRINNNYYNQIWINCNRSYLIFDADDEQSYNIISRYLHSNNIYNEGAITRSFKGVDYYYKRHFWFKADDNYNNLVEGQIKFNGGEIFFGIGCILGEYKDTIIDVDNIPTLDYNFYNELTSLLGKKERDNGVIVKKNPVSPPPIPNIMLNQPKNINKEELIKEYPELIELIDGLEPSRYNDYSDWLNFYFITLNEKINLDIFDYFSSKSKKYNREENYKILKNITPKNGYTLATLYYWIKTDNLPLFNKLCKTRKDFWEIQMDNYSVAKLYYNLYPNDYIYSYNLGWFEYNENNILINRGNKIPVKLYNNFANYMQNYAIEQRNLLNNDDPKMTDKMKIFTKFYSKVGDSLFIEKTIKQLSGLYLDDDLEKKINNKKYFAFANALYNYENNEFRLIQKNDFITLSTGYDLNYNTVGNKIVPKINEKYKKEIKSIINSIFEDKEINKFWFYTTAISLFGNEKERFYIHSGRGGGNGKGLTQRILLNCLGQYYKQVSNNFLMGSIGKGGADTELAGCLGIRYLSISEPDDTDNKKFNISNLKSYSGNDPISCRGLYKDTIQFIPQFTINISTNEIPKMSNIDGGVKRRLVIIDYPFEFRDKEKITNPAIQKPINYELKEKTIHNQEFIQTFILMLIHKAFKYKSIEFKTPAKILNHNETYYKDNNEIFNWFNENIQITENNKDMIKSSDLLNNYNSSVYCHKKLRPVDFSKLIEKLEINKKIIHNTSYYTNIKFIDFVDEGLDI